MSTLISSSAMTCENLSTGRLEHFSILNGLFDSREHSELGCHRYRKVFVECIDCSGVEKISYSRRTMRGLRGTYLGCRLIPIHLVDMIHNDLSVRYPVDNQGLYLRRRNTVQRLLPM